MLQPQRLKVESAVSALRSRGVPQGKLCNMLKNVKVSLLQVYEIDYFWSTWLLDASEGFCNLSGGRWPLVLQPPTLAVRVGGVGSEVASA